MTEAPAHVSRNIEKEENLGTRQFGEACETRVPQGPLSPAALTEELSRGEGELAWDFQSTTGAAWGWGGPGWPPPTLPAPALGGPVGYSREELLAKEGDAFYFQLRNSHHNLGSC